jgi:hypothetical protein
MATFRAGREGRETRDLVDAQRRERVVLLGHPLEGELHVGRHDGAAVAEPGVGPQGELPRLLIGGGLPRTGDRGGRSDGFVVHVSQAVEEQIGDE